MTKTAVTQGREALGYDVRREFLLAPEMDAALDVAATVSGLSRNALLRHILAGWLEDVGIVSPEVQATLRATKSAGPRRKD